MPLSEEEQRQFDQLERALAADDPKFVSAMRGTALRGRYKKRAVLAGLGFIVGLCILMAGAILRQTLLGVVGFIVMVALLYLLAVSVRRVGHTDPQTASPNATPSGEPGPASSPSDTSGVIPMRRPRQSRKPRRQPEGDAGSGGSFMERMEHRWKRRRDEGY